jgi:phosphoribosylglycinamide formyltransferase-1
MVAVFTYQSPHRKSEELINGLVAMGETIDAVIGVPFTPRPERPVVFHHRPDQNKAAHPKDITARHKLPYVEVASIDQIPTGLPLCLTAIGLLVPASVLARTKVINCHAGLLPIVRGLDAFKWAVLEDKPLGVSLHWIDADIDRGDHIASVPTPVLKSDTLDSLAQRHYDNEVQTLIQFRRHLANTTPPLHAGPAGPARKRMPAAVERDMMAHFPAYRDAFAA